MAMIERMARMERIYRGKYKCSRIEKMTRISKDEKVYNYTDSKNQKSSTKYGPSKK